VATFVPFLLLAIWARSVSVSGFEQGIVDNLALSDNLPGDLVRVLNTLGNPVNWVIFVLVVALVVGVMRGGYAGLFVGATYLVDFVADLTKAWVERGRPDTIAAHSLFGVDSFGFPSGHTARAAAFVGALLWVFVPARWRLPVAVAGGLLLGVAWMAITAALL
jgi:membrane-associated phospholipid phosphatase